MFPTGGVTNDTDFKVTQHGLGDNTVDVAAGTAAVAGTSVAHQGSYLVYSAATVTVQPPTPPAANPRIDIVVLGVEDGQVTGTHQYRWFIQVIAGAEAGTPVVPATPANCLLLATIARQVGVSNILTGAPIVNVASRANRGGMASYPPGGAAPDLNLINANGLYWSNVAGAATTLNMPAGAGQCVVHAAVADSNNQVQSAFELASPVREWLRAKVAGAWNAWVQVPAQPQGSFGTSAIGPVAAHADANLALAPAIAGIVSLAGDTYTVIRPGMFSILAAMNIAGNISSGVKLVINGAQTLVRMYDYDWTIASRSQIEWQGMLVANNTIKVNAHNNDVSARTFTGYCWLNYMGS
jgi:hypothetical protein